jgi:hypothetical protein
MIIEGKINGSVDFGKRISLPGITIKYECPLCGTPYCQDGSERRLTYPSTEQPYELWGYCSQCNHDFVIGKIVLDLTVRVVEE